MKKLHIKGKLISIHDKKQVLDEDNNLVYSVKSKAVSIHDKTVIHDANDNEVAYLHRKVLSLHNTYIVEMADGCEFEVNEELMHLTKDVINIDALGLKMLGNFTEHDYQIVDQNDNVLAKAHQKWISLHDVYYLDIMDESKMDILVTLFIVLNHLGTQKRAQVASSSVTVDNNK